MPAFGKRIVETRRTAFARAAAVRAPGANATASRKPENVAVATEAARASTWTRVPYLSLAIFAVLWAVFWAELTYPVDPARAGAPTLSTLIALGGLSARLVGSGEWWRIFSGPLLHANFGHLFGNGIVLVLAGFYLEPLIGRRWFAGVYVLGGLGGALASIALNPPDLVTVGASGAITGLLGATLVCSFADAAGEKHALRMRWISGRLLLSSLIPVAARGGMHIDYSAHIGGAVAGGLAGFALQAFWPEKSERPDHASVALALAASGVVASLLSLILVAGAYPSWAARGDTIQSAEVPDGIEHSAALVVRYPRDPNSHYMRAVYYLDAQDLADAEQQLRITLSLSNDPGFLQEVRIMLALTLVREGHDDQARILSSDDCQNAPSLAQQRFQLLQKAGVCP
jgi:rhomboid protease GluP